MIDRSARDTAARLLEKFVSGEISNDEMMDSWPASRDIALGQIAYHLTSTTDDMKEYRFSAAEAPPELSELYTRTAHFLRSNYEYMWPQFSDLGATILAILTLGVSRVLSAPMIRRFRAAGDVQAWPYLRTEDAGVDGPRGT
jgi:hypothetical protein